MRIIYFMIAMFLCSPCFSQTVYRGAVNSIPNKMVYSEQIEQIQETDEPTKFKDSERSVQMKKDLKNMRGTIGSSADAIKARNLLILKEVLDFKMQDETLKAEINKLKDNREFNTRLLRALNQLDNKKLRNQKNQEIMNILNDAGNRIYNSLSN